MGSIHVQVRIHHQCLTWYVIQAVAVQIAFRNWAHGCRVCSHFLERYYNSPWNERSTTWKSEEIWVKKGSWKIPKFGQKLWPWECHWLRRNQENKQTSVAHFWPQRSVLQKKKKVSLDPITWNLAVINNYVSWSTMTKMQHFKTQLGENYWMLLFLEKKIVTRLHSKKEKTKTMLCAPNIL